MMAKLNFSPKPCNINELTDEPRGSLCQILCAGR
jgi:hypothetical protein